MESIWLKLAHISTECLFFNLLMLNRFNNLKTLVISSRIYIYIHHTLCITTSDPRSSIKIMTVHVIGERVKKSCCVAAKLLGLLWLRFLQSGCSTEVVAIRHCVWHKILVYVLHESFTLPTYNSKACYSPTTHIGLSSLGNIFCHNIFLCV